VATELVINSWCDVCLEAARNRAGETLSVNVTGTPAFDVEVCKEHGAPLRDALAVLAALGRAPGKTVRPGATGPSKGNVGAARGKPDQQAGTGGTCPECGYSNGTRAGLRSHLRRKHDKSLADVGLSPARFTCEECGGKFDAGQGLSAHVRLIHRARAKQSA
jgi:hypothetical protein